MAPDIQQTTTVISSQELTPAQAANRSRLIHYLTLLIFVAAIISGGYGVYLILQADYQPWQLLASAGVNLAFSGAAALANYLNWRGRPNAGLAVVITGLLAAALLNAILLAGTGLALGLAIIIVIWLLAAHVASPRWGNIVLVAGFISGIAAGMLELTPLPVQVVIPELQVFTPALSVGVIGIGGLLVWWQFKHYTLRAKLISVFLGLSILAVGAATFLNYRSTSAALTKDVGDNLQRLAGTQALAVGDLLERQIDALQVLSLNKILQAKIGGRNSTYAGSQSAISDQLFKLNEQWHASGNTDPFVQAHFNSVTNAAASELNQFRILFPDHVELLITDRYGGLVAATHRPPDYSQATKGWWQTAFNNGQGAIYIDLQIDNADAIPHLAISVPVYAQGTRTVIGILHSVYRLNTLRDLLGKVALGETGNVELYFPSGLELEADRKELALADDLPPDVLAGLRRGENLFVYSEVDNTPIVVGGAHVTTVTGNPVIDNLRWAVITRQNTEEAVRPIQAALRNTLLVAMIIAGAAGVMGLGLTHLVAGPLLRLTAVARQVAAGNLAARGQVESGDEVGQLAATFNDMTYRLQVMIGSLEEQVAERTRQLETVVEVSRRLTGILDLSDLMRQVVTLTKENFNYYHVHIYLLEGDTLLMAEGYGEAGAEMKRRGHNIPLATPHSLVARAAREGRVITVGNVRENPDWLPNPLLPETHAEMAVPVLLGEEVVGVLDVQSEKVGGLTQSDEASLQALANQIATAVRNARAFAQTQEALYEAQRLQRVYTGQAWEQFSSSRNAVYEFRRPTALPLQAVNTPEVEAALQQEQTVTLITNGQHGQPPIDSRPENQGEPAGRRMALATPLKLRDEIIGVLGIHDEDVNRRWTEDEIALIEAVGEQMSLAIENARLFEHTQRDAWRNQVVGETTAHVWASAEIEEVMRAAVAELGEKFKASEVIIRLGTETDLPRETDPALRPGNDE